MKGSGQGRRRRLAVALLLSGVMHAGVVALLWAAASRGAQLPPLKVYAVNIVSPPPVEAGEPAAPEPTPEPAQPEPAAAAPEPAAPEAAPPAPRPEPARPTPPRETRPAPAPPRETRPAPTPPRETPPPARETPPPARAQPTQPAPTQPAAAASRPAETPRRTEPTPRPAERATGSAPVATSAGGQDLNVRIEGAEFTDQAYLDNIYRQVRRYFRKPDEARTDQAEIRFWINRDGSVSDIAVVRSAGGFAFRAAAMEAVEQAGINRAFGPLPRSYPADRLLVSFTFRPDR